MKKIIFPLLLAVLLFPMLASATCTVTFDKHIHFHEETVSTIIICDADNEKSKAYTLTWRNETAGGTLQTDTGTTPAIPGTEFFESYTTGADTGEYFVNATLTGSNLEGVDSANITDSSETDLVITNIIVTNITKIYIGWWLGVQVDVVDNDGSDVSGAECHFAITDNHANAIDDDEHTTAVGHAHAHFELLESKGYVAGEDYLIDIMCFCGVASTSDSCIDSLGSEVSAVHGSAQESFMITNTENKEGGDEEMIGIALVLIAALFFGIGYTLKREFSILFHIVGALFITSAIFVMAFGETGATATTLYTLGRSMMWLLIIAIIFTVISYLVGLIQSLQDAARGKDEIDQDD